MQAKIQITHTRKVVAVLILSLGILIFSFGPGSIPSANAQGIATETPEAAGSLTLQEVIQIAIEKHRLDASFNYYYNLKDVIEDGEWGVGKAEKIQKDTFEVIPADFSMILSYKDGNGNWRVILPNEADPYLDLLNLFPESLLDDEVKAYIRDAYKINVRANYSNHYLPWTMGSAAIVYQNYSTHGEGQLDFGFAGNIRTTKAGTLVFAYDSHTWSRCAGQTLSWCHSNYPYAWYYNNAVVIRHANGEYSSYLHMQTDSIPPAIMNNCNNGNGGPCTAVNLPVGTIIGTVGNIGQSTHPHLHYGTGDFPYGRCNYPDVHDEDGDGNTTETNICTGGIDGSHRISTGFYEKPYSASNCGTGDGQDPTLCMLYYPRNTNLFSSNPGSGLGSTTLVSPSGTIADTTPAYTWNKVDTATWYYLWVSRINSDNSVTTVHTRWYEGSSVCGASTCSITPAVTLSNGSYRWWVQTWNLGGTGPWSSAMNFSVGTIPPEAARLASPNGSITDYTPTYTWDKVDAATWYYLWVNGPTGNVFRQWYQASAVCGANTCSVTPNKTLGGGSHRWWIQTWNSGGYGPWSDHMDFNLPGPPPAATLVSPSGNITDTTPIYTWNKVNAATWYYLWVDGPAGNVLKQWYEGSAICGGSTCSITPGSALGGGDHRWWIQTWNPAGYGRWSSGMGFSLPPPATAPIDDDFNSLALNPTWHWYNEDPTHWSLTAAPGSLRIITQAKDIWQRNNTAPLLLQSLLPSSNYRVEIQTRIVITPTANHHQGGLVIFGDFDNYVRFTYAYIDGPTFEFAKEIGGGFQPIQVPAPPGINDFHLRIVKLGISYSAYYSPDGANWTLIGTHQNVNIPAREAGLLAFQAVGVTSVEIPADFDYFRVATGSN